MRELVPLLMPISCDPELSVRQVVPDAACTAIGSIHALLAGRAQCTLVGRRSACIWHAAVAASNGLDWHAQCKNASGTLRSGTT
eukprot:4156238-Pleurochrysis_carterae.AAC.1